MESGAVQSAKYTSLSVIRLIGGYSVFMSFKMRVTLLIVIAMLASFESRKFFSSIEIYS